MSLNGFTLMKYKAEAEKIFMSLKKNPERQRALLVLLKDNGFEDVAIFLNKLRKEFM